MAEYPECEKLASVKDKSQIIGEFLDEMRAQGKFLCEEDEDMLECNDCGNELGWHEMVQVRGNIQDILAEYFGIDMNKVEEERRAMLDSIRANQ